MWVAMERAMRRASILLAMLCWGCTNAGLEPAGLGPSIETGAIAAQAAAVEPAPSEVRKVQHRAVEEARRPLRAFLAEKGRDCTSPRLKEAARKTTETATALAASMRPEYDASLEAGSAVLDLADGAKARGCHAEARRLYDFVMRNFAGLGYAALRDRATAGLKDLPVKG